MPPPSLRLVVLKTRILPRKINLAVISPDEQVSIGRDVLTTGARIRLKEMEVSKFHASLFYDWDRNLWSVVDVGSVHGTFVVTRSAGAPRELKEPAKRLSAPRTSSIPCPLYHFDRLRIGSTTFEVHIHSEDLSCEACASTVEGQNEIPMWVGIESKDQQPKTDPSVPIPVYSAQPILYADIPPAEPPNKKRKIAETTEDPKLKLAKLKRTLLARRTPTEAEPAEPPPLPVYIDRAAQRRARHPEPPPPAIVPQPQSQPQPQLQPAPRIYVPKPRRDSPILHPPSSICVVSEAPVPISDSNIGHQLLLKQGWKPGTALGGRVGNDAAAHGLVEPLTPASTFNRRGLGAVQP